MVDTDRASLAVSLIAAYVSAASVLAVYHLFALQYWVERCRQAESAATIVAETTTSDDLTRVTAREGCEAALQSYPWWQILGIIASLSAVALLGWNVSTLIGKISRLYTAVPLLLLDGVVVLSTLGATLRTRRAIHRTMARL